MMCPSKQSSYVHNTRKDSYWQILYFVYNTYMATKQDKQTPQSFLSKMFELMFYANRRLGIFTPPDDLGPYLEEKRKEQERPYSPVKLLLFASTFTVDMIEDVPVVRFKPRKRTAGKRMLYFHGGAYVDDATALHFHFIDSLIRESPMEVYMPIYPKTPTHTATQVIDAISRLVPALPAFDIIAGDSAGGGLALALTSILRLKADHLILISPWLSLSLSHPEIEQLIPADPLLNREYLREIGRIYKGELDWEDPRVSPLYAEIDKQIQVSVFCGTHEIFLPDIRDFVQRMQKTQDTLYVEMEGMNHDYPLFPMKEGLAAVQKIVERIR